MMADDGENELLVQLFARNFLRLQRTTIPIQIGSVWPNRVCLAKWGLSGQIESE